MWNRSVGLALMAAGCWVLATPLWTGEWIIALLAAPMALAGFATMQATFRTAEPVSGKWAGYLRGMVLLAAAAALFSAPNLAVAALKTLLVIYLAILAVLSFAAAWQNGQAKTAAADLITAAAAMLLAGVIFVLAPAGSIIAAGLAVGFTLIATGWRMSFAVRPLHNEATRESMVRHLNGSLGIADYAATSARHQQLLRHNPLRSAENWRWMSYFALTLFAIHAVRMGANLSLEGMIPPIAATLGDLLIALFAFWLVIAPLRVMWSRLSRRVERHLWRIRMEGRGARDRLSELTQWAVNVWLDRRYVFALNFMRARASIFDGLSLAVGQGIIVAALLAAINSIWGFSWYFNTENWASGIYQAVTGPRVDVWRKAMTDAVLKQHAGDPQAAFALHPPGVEDGGDFSFLVIGDPGEGDSSQESLKDRYLLLSQREDVKFVVISSDVIYPAGESKDYERNFYLPFKGVKKPIYAIPGNHDWFNALGAFAANLMTPEAALAALDARAAVDQGLTLLDRNGRDRLVDEARRLRTEYGLATALQAAPYFDIQTDSFALIAIDTGVLRSIDSGQQQWLEGALRRARGKFIMAVTGHPRFAGGHDTADEGSTLRALFDLLESGGVRVAMAGDTHDFEYYLQERANGGGQIHHFLNGGGGAYLSIGTALDWPSEPATEDWAYYPSTAALQQKLDRETPFWKRPARWWINALGAWPTTVETLSGIFDFNKAPFFQSFMEVEVRPSRNEIRFILHGAGGPLRWRDLDTSLAQKGMQPDEEVVFAFPIHQAVP